jgi:hypothetical protein
MERYRKGGHRHRTPRKSMANGSHETESYGNRMSRNRRARTGTREQRPAGHEGFKSRQLHWQGLDSKHLHILKQTMVVSLAPNTNYQLHASKWMGSFTRGGIIAVTVILDPILKWKRLPLLMALALLIIKNKGVLLLRVLTTTLAGQSTTISNLQRPN